MLSTFKSFFFFSDVQIILGFSLFYSLVSYFIYWVCCISRAKECLRPFHGIVAPYILVPMSIFALSSALLGVSVWEHFQSNAKAISQEGQAIESYISLVKGMPFDNGEILVEDAKNYTKSVIHDEWGIIATERHANHETAQHLHKLIQDTVNYSINQKLPSFVQTALLNAAQNINIARNVRLSIINDEPDAMRWLSIILLGVMVLISVAMVQLDKPKPMLATLIASTVSICIVLSLVGMSVNPFTGLLTISKAPLQQILLMK